MDGIKIEVTGNIARVTDRPARLTSGMVGLPVTFTFDSHWDGLSKTAVFRAGKTELIAEGLETETTVPWEVLDKPNVWLSIGVYGVNADGTVAIPTIWANVCLICEGVNPDGDVSTAPTLPVWQRLWNAVGNLLGLTTNAKDNLVEAINEVHNIALAGGIETDPTLSVSGKAADAKVTGDVIQTHANDQKNPHKVTAEQVGARPNTWTPVATDLLNAYPVGAIYLSVNSTSPASLFGGTWTQLKDRFLLGAGDTYTGNKTGGAAEVTLTVNQIPSHRHSTAQATVSDNGLGFDAYTVQSDHLTTTEAESKYYPNYTAYTGGGAAHNNMPPYLVVYMWKRTA